MDDLVSSLLVALPAIVMVVDPLACAPVYISLTAGDSPTERRHVARRAAITTWLVLSFFALAGGLVVQLFGVSLGAFRAAGGAILFLAALDMLQGRGWSRPARTPAELDRTDIAVIPLSIPLLAGPGAIASVMVLMSRSPAVASALGVLCAVALASAASWLVLRGAEWIERAVPRALLGAIARVTGLILAGMAVEFVVAGIRDIVIGRGG